MGFRYWYEGFLFILFFAAIIVLPCSFVAIWGTKMINDLGNFPTKVANIQIGFLWKLCGVEVVSFLMLIIFYRLFS
jgi:hypothetical protein